MRRRGARACRRSPCEQPNLRHTGDGGVQAKPKLFAAGRKFCEVYARRRQRIRSCVFVLFKGKIAAGVGVLFVVAIPEGCNERVKSHARAISLRHKLLICNNQLP